MTILDPYSFAGGLWFIFLGGLMVLFAPRGADGLTPAIIMGGVGAFVLSFAVHIPPEWIGR